MGTIFLIIKLIFMLPSIIGVINNISKIISGFKGAGFWEIVKLIGDILSLILGLAPLDKALARSFTRDLKQELKALDKQRRMGKLQTNALPGNLVALKEKVAACARKKGCKSY